MSEPFVRGTEKIKPTGNTLEKVREPLVTQNIDPVWVSKQPNLQEQR